MRIHALLAFFVLLGAAASACGESLPQTGDPPPDAGVDASAEDGGPYGDAGGPDADAGGSTALVLSLGAPASRIAVDGDWIYVVRGADLDARLVRVKLPEAAPPEVVDPGAQVFGNVVTTSAGVFWGSIDGLRFLAHGAPVGNVQVLSSEPKISGIRPNGATLWFSRFDLASNGGKLLSCQLPDCMAPATINADYPFDFVFTNLARVDIAWATAAAGTPSVLVNGIPVATGSALVAPSWMATDDTSAFIAVDDGLYSVTPGAGGTAEVRKLLAATAGDRVRSVKTEGQDRLVLAQKDSLATCLAASGACAPKVIATVANDTVEDIAVVGGFYYFVTKKGDIRRTARP